MSLEIIQKRAFEYFEKGRYPECLAVIQDIAPGQREIQLRILEAVCLSETGAREEAEICLRDLRLAVPDSAEVCIFLGRILQEKGEDEARAAFSEAVRLDPENPEGLRWYADFLTGEGDYAASIPVLVRLHTLTSDPEDLCRLMHVYRKDERPLDAIRAYENDNTPGACRSQYLQALCETARYREICDQVPVGDDTPPAELILLVRALGAVSPGSIDKVVLPRIQKEPDPGIISEYIRFLIQSGSFREAAGVWSTYLSKEEKPEYQILICPALTGLHELKKAVGIYHAVLFPDPPDVSNEELTAWLAAYRDLLCEDSGNRSHQVFRETAGEVLHPVYLAMAGSSAEEEGLPDLARSYFLKAFRADIVHGGYLYSRFLKRSGDDHEWEKIVTYILKNAVKVRDIERICKYIFTEAPGDISLLRLVHSRLYRYLPLLSSRGRTIYCRAAGIIASEELNAGRYEEGMRFCIEGLAEVPPQEEKVAESLFSILMACKTPGLPMSYPGSGKIGTTRQEPKNPLPLSCLTPAEEAAVLHLMRHRVSTELELREITGTKRVAGLMNRLIRKISTEGWQVVVKEGFSESGEVYRYVGP